MNMTKVVTRHLWADYIDKCENIRHTPKYQELYKMRKEKIERVFADAKEKHAMRYTPYRGLTQVTNWAKLKFACLNLKKLALWKSKDNHNTNKYPIFTRFFIAIWKNYNSFKQNPIQAFARMGFIYSLRLPKLVTSACRKSSFRQAVRLSRMCLNFVFFRASLYKSTAARKKRKTQMSRNHQVSGHFIKKSKYVCK